MADQVLREFHEGDCLILQNEISEIPYIVEKAHERGMQIVLNPSPMDEKIFDINLNHIDCFILNEVEARTLVQSDADQDVLLKQLTQRFPHAEIVLTLGENGSMYAGTEGVAEQKAYKVETVDTTAAGDTFTGYYMAARLQGQTVKKALHMASKASAIAVSMEGAAPSIPKKDEVERFEED